ncbi:MULTISPECIES: molybdopterin-binding protein [Halanaerobium]|jgi:molybdopterin molybdotransferase|uniref:Molybdopterin molybdenumtransferase n=1 Tax=Halanaerobium congolense TaxID=54121 RepID=A0A1G6R240_9FIRM|nr:MULTISPECIES: gephyrin-like molybdotransferase Glp [Halanaerobium]PUU87735.1 MAG: molybdopterin molybdotransferase [Halanaerobium sp.]PUU91494.1 MAG: molybdopterin molybdotransferase [Halanaerobium sp.]TDS32862.1 molybdopterin molybdochelatase [Halanaerobium congolense]TDX41861.1 molybdopterin molybdochelatase [Halanaerobium congolense]SDC98709.1 molybdopterin molybdochelatase [Halanaerobium congolense]
MREFLELNPLEKFWQQLESCLEKKKLQVEKIKLNNAAGRILAEDILSPVDLPPFSRSTVDGYAVKAADTAGASASMPTYLDIIGSVQMGQKTEIELKSGQVAAVPTGGMIPQNADAVLMIEDTEKIESKMIESFKALAVGENIVQKAEDIGAGELLFKKGHKIMARDIGALAGLGITEFDVFQKAAVSIISTGDELIPAEAKAKAGQIRDINSYSIAAYLDKIGAETKKVGIIKDKFDNLKSALQKELGQDLVLISGGSSVGIKDMTIDLLNSLGEPGVLLHGLAIKPGKPTILADIEGTIVVGLPGHPASAWTVNTVLSAEIVRVLNGEKKPSEMGSENNKYFIEAELTRNLVSDKGREEYIPVKIIEKNEKLFAEPLLAKSSLITNLAYGDAVLKIPQNKEGIDKGELVRLKLIE